MGNWNRRYMPRKKYRHCDYEDRPSSPPKPYNNHSDSRMSTWEIDYCNSVRVSWKKVVASKKYIVCYPSVLDWDASAGKEALQNAKERYWATRNGLPCDNPLPDPDLYIDEIDWNPHMDPELMAEIDLPVFDPDKAQKDETSEANNEWVECAQTQDDKNQYTSEDPWEINNVQGAAIVKDTSNNPWEINNMQGAGSLKDISDDPWEINNTQGAGSLNDTSDNNLWGRNNTQGAGSSKDLQGWDRWDDSVNMKSGDPWDQRCSNPVESLKENAWRSGKEDAWRSGNESSGWNNSKSSHFVDYTRGNCRSFYEQNMAARQEGLGQGRGRGRGQGENHSWGSGAMSKNAGGQTNFVDRGYSCGTNYYTDSKERGWREKCGGNEPKYWDSQASGRGGRSFRGGGKKRESSIQHTSKYKSSKYHGDTYQDSQRW